MESKSVYICGKNENERVFLVRIKIIVNNKCKNCPSMAKSHRTTQYVKLMTLQSMGVRTPKGMNVLLFCNMHDKKVFRSFHVYTFEYMTNGYIDFITRAKI